MGFSLSFENSSSFSERTSLDFSVFTYKVWMLYEPRDLLALMSLDIQLYRRICQRTRRRKDGADIHDVTEAAKKNKSKKSGRRELGEEAEGSGYGTTNRIEDISGEVDIRGLDRKDLAYALSLQSTLTVLHAGWALECTKEQIVQECERQRWYLKQVAARVMNANLQGKAVDPREIIMGTINRDTSRAFLSVFARANSGMKMCILMFFPRIISERGRSYQCLIGCSGLEDSSGATPVHTCAIYIQAQFDAM